MQTKSFNVNNRAWKNLTNYITLQTDVIYCIQPNYGNLYFYQGDANPTKEDIGIGTDPSGGIKFKCLSGVKYFIRVLDPKKCTVTITEVAQ